MKKIGIFTICLDRLYYVYHCTKSLKEMAGCEYEQIFIDNGSTDGTYEWLLEEGYKVIRNEENKGISFAIQQGLDYFKDKGVDIIIKLDSDCKFLTPNTLKDIVEFYDYVDKNYPKDRYSVSPQVEGLGRPPIIHFMEKIGRFNLGRLHLIGGIFEAIRTKDWEILKETTLPFNDVNINKAFQKCGFKMGYLTDYKCSHFETTAGQVKRYPAYFTKEYKY